MRPFAVSTAATIYDVHVEPNIMLNVLSQSLRSDVTNDQSAPLPTWCNWVDSFSSIQFVRCERDLIGTWPTNFRRKLKLI